MSDEKCQRCDKLREELEALNREWQESKKALAVATDAVRAADAHAARVSRETVHVLSIGTKVTLPNEMRGEIQAAVIDRGGTWYDVAVWTPACRLEMRLPASDVEEDYLRLPEEKQR